MVMENRHFHDLLKQIILLFCCVSEEAYHWPSKLVSVLYSGQSNDKCYLLTTTYKIFLQHYEITITYCKKRIEQC